MRLAVWLCAHRHIVYECRSRCKAQGYSGSTIKLQPLIPMVNARRASVLEDKAYLGL